MLLGAIVNGIAILAGGTVGLIFGKALPKKLKDILIQGVGLAVLLIGAQMALETKNALIIIISLVVGGLIGELIDIEQRLANLGQWMEKKLSRNKEKNNIGPANDERNFTKGFVTTSLIFCVGAMAIMGALESGLKGEHTIYFAKALLDGITAMVFASSLGVGVLFSAAAVLIYQGALTIGAAFLQDVFSSQVIAEMSAVGGLLIIAIGFNILQIKEIKVGNLLPGIFLAIPLAMIFN